MTASSDEHQAKATVEMAVVASMCEAQHMLPVVQIAASLQGGVAQFPISNTQYMILRWGRIYLRL
jgi:hypothetical protein